MRESDLEWDESKNSENLIKHGVSFHNAQFAFLDRRGAIAKDHTHSKREQRFYYFGSDREGTGVYRQFDLLTEINEFA